MDNLDEKLVDRYMAGECSETGMKQIYDWFHASEDNRKEWLKLRMVPVKNSFIQFSESEQVEHSYQELRQGHIDLTLLEKKISRKIVRRFMRYAAGFLLLIGLSSISYLYFTYQEPPKMVAVAVSGNEQVRQIRLDDNTDVWISEGSKIEYPEKFGKKERVVTVEGKVYFEVSADANRPFFVKTEDYTVKVLGTSFEINAFRFRQLSDVTLVEGKIEILDRHLVSLCALQDGQQFEIDKLANCFTTREVDAEILTAWHCGELEFDGLTFAEIARSLERHYNVQIMLENGIIKDKKLVGSLSFQKDIHEMMRVIAMVIPIQYDIKTNTTVHIHSKK